MGKGTREISLSFTTIDYAHETAKFKTLAGAQKWAHARIGAHPEIGGYYAVSGSGSAKITARGCSYEELFPAPVSTGPSEYLRCSHDWDCDCVHYAAQEALHK